MIKVLEKTDTLLSLVAEHAPVSFTELQSISGLNKATLSQILKSMTELAWLKRDDDSRFRIGTRISSLAGSKDINLRLRDKCREAATRLNEELNELVTVAVFTEGERRVITKIEANHLVQVNESTSSSPILMFHTATGLLLLSQLDDNALSIFAGRHHLEAQLAEHRENLDQTRRNGYSKLISGQEDSIAMAVGVYDKSGRMIAAIGFSAPCYRFTLEETAALALLNKYAKEISF